MALVSRFSKAAVATSVAAGIAGMVGFTKGLGSQDLSSGVYEMATGNPDIDEYVFGKDVGIREMMMPLPGERRRQTANMMMSPNTWSRYSAAAKPDYDGNNYFSNTPPKVDGNIVFGAYNSRLG